MVAPEEMYIEPEKKNNNNKQKKQTNKLLMNLD